MLVAVTKTAETLESNFSATMTWFEQVWQQSQYNIYIQRTDSGLMRAGTSTKSAGDHYIART